MADIEISTQTTKTTFDSNTYFIVADTADTSGGVNPLGTWKKLPSNILALADNVATSLGNKVDITTTVNGQPLSDNIIITVGSGLAGYVNLADYVNDFTGATDQHARLVFADNDAVAANKPLYHPGGIILSNSPWTPSVALVGVLAPPVDPNSKRSVIKFSVPGATSTTRYMNFTAKPNGVWVENIIIQGSTTANPNTAIAGIGLSFGQTGISDTGTVAVRRGGMRNVTVTGFGQNYDIEGWLLSLINCWSTYGGIGAKFEQLNGCMPDVVFENNLQDFQLFNSSGTSFARIQCEGTFGNAASTIDNCQSITVQSMYLEQPGRTVPWLIIGGTSLCSNIEIQSLITTGCGEGVEPIYIDHANSVSVGGYYLDSGSSCSIAYTANARRIKPSFQEVQYGFQNTAFNTGLQNKALNLFPNSYFQSTSAGIRNGVKMLQLSNVTLSSDSTHVRSGTSALKITGTNGTNNNYVAFRINDTRIINALKNNPMTIGAWVYIPNNASQNPTTTNFLDCRIVAETYNGTTFVDYAATGDGFYRVNKWNFMWLNINSVNSATTELYIEVYLNNSSNNVTAAESITLGSLHLAVGYVEADIFEGRIEDSPLNNVRLNGGAMTIRAPQNFFVSGGTYAQDSSQYWEVGDKVEFTDADVTRWGSRCYTAGAGSAAVWKDLT